MWRLWTDRLWPEECTGSQYTACAGKLTSARTPIAAEPSLQLLLLEFLI